MPKRRKQLTVLDLGTCCYCGTAENVRNVVMLAVAAPVPGTGWGCVQCCLPNDGALAVLCDDCAERKREPSYVFKGPPVKKQYVHRSTLREPFRHILALHPEAPPGDPG